MGDLLAVGLVVFFFSLSIGIVELLKKLE